jgi:pyruvate dehydrogenase E1 component beta subunit
MVEAIRSTLEREMERDQRVMVLGEDVGRSGGVFRATDGLQARFGPDRVVDMPVAEAAIVSASIGLATAGLLPVAELQFLGFAYQAYHQIAGQLGTHARQGVRPLRRAGDRPRPLRRRGPSA